MPDFTHAQLAAILNSDADQSLPDPSRGDGEVRRRRGAQPGNRNALKHGFYSRIFTPIDRKDLDRLPPSDLQAEINLLRVYIRRVIELNGASLDASQAIAMLRALSVASIGLSRLMHTSKKIAPSQDDLLHGLNHLIKNTLTQMRSEGTTVESSNDES
jgi:hypothetical protein